MLRESRVGESRWLVAVHSFGEGPLKKGILDVKLMNWPIPGVSYSEDCADSGRLDNGTESFIVVNTGALSEAAKDPTSLVSIQRSISMKFMFKDPFSSDHVGIGGPRNKIPSIIVHEGGIFLFHGATPVMISKSIAARTGNWSQIRNMKNAGLNVSRLPTSRHSMAVVNRCDWYSTNRRTIFDIPRG
jgi:hypothetical protein